MNIHLHKSLLSLIIFSVLIALVPLHSSAQTKILHYTETSGFDHNTRGNSLTMFETIAVDFGLTVDDDQTGDAFNSLTSLQEYAVVVFSNTSGNNILDAAQRQNFEDYIAGGGNYIGIHAASDTYRHSTANGGSTGTWDFYAELIGASVQNNPNHVSGTPTHTMTHQGNHPLIMGLMNPWVKAEEYYYWENGYYDNTNVVVLEVESTGPNSYDAARPMAWYRELPSTSNVFYTALGHKANNFSGDDDFIQMMINAVEWTTGIPYEPTLCLCQEENSDRSTYMCMEHLLPGFIESEHFDEGGQDSAYNDDGNRQGNDFRPGVNVDVVDKANASNGMAIGYTNIGEWVEYTVQAEPGVYQIDLSYASNSNNSSDMALTLNGVDLATFESIPSTNSWETFSTVSVMDIEIEGGACMALRVTFSTAGNIDIDALTFTKTGELNTGEVEGCTNAEADNYNSEATVDDGSCIISGCTDYDYLEFNPNATLENGNCITLKVAGCIYADASNYDSAANIDDGSCLFSAEDCLGDLNNDGSVTAGDLTEFLSVFGQSCD